MLIERLLGTPFPGRDEIRAQLATAEVAAEGYGDTRTIVFRLDKSAPRAETNLRVPVEAQAVDKDGGEIVILLHVVNGTARELEIYRADGENVLDDSFADDVVVLVNPDSS